MQSFLLAASILSANFENLSAQIKAAENAGVDWIHFDVMDGHFVPNLTMGPFIIETCRRVTNLPIDVHLMVKSPAKFIDMYAQAGASHISIHIEGNPAAGETIEKIRKTGCQPGIVLNPGTPPNEVLDILPLVDIVLVMTVEPGYSGQGFLPEVLKKIKQIRTMINRFKIPPHLEVDGGINTRTLPQAFTAGADTFVSATGIFKYPNGIKQGVRALRDSINVPSNT